MKLLWKVCGMRDKQNIQEVLGLKPDYMGFIFFEKSPRNISTDFDEGILTHWNADTKKVGVFVNEKLETVKSYIKKYKLDVLQLHGKESPEYCQELRREGVQIMKAFSVDEEFNFENTEAYQNVTDIFLFDTKAKGAYGGHGLTFDWNLLNKYSGNKPFLLAGGIDLSNLQELKDISHPSFIGIDVNSRFELEPALKDISRLKKLKDWLERY